MITPGELCVGDFITVHSWIHEERDVENFLYGTVTKITHMDHSFEGDPFVIRAICLPFIVVDDVRHTNGCYAYHSQISIDTRRVVLMPLTKEYIKALTGKEV